MIGRMRPAWVLLVILGAVALLGLGYAATVHWTPRTPIPIAFANSLAGPSSSAGTESLTTIRLAVDEANRQGGVGGRPVELVLFDDASSADTARDNVQAIADSPCLAVLGHYLSTASLTQEQDQRFDQ